MPDKTLGRLHTEKNKFTIGLYILNQRHPQTYLSEKTKKKTTIKASSITPTIR